MATAAKASKRATSGIIHQSLISFFQKRLRLIDCSLALIGRCVYILEDVVVDDNNCDAANTPASEQKCQIACPGDCVISSWTSWTPCQHVRVLFSIERLSTEIMIGYTIAVRLIVFHLSWAAAFYIHFCLLRCVYSARVKGDEKDPSSATRSSIEVVRNWSRSSLVRGRLVADASFTTGRCRNGARANLWADRVAEKASVLGSPLVFETTATSSIPCINIITVSHPKKGCL